MPEDKEYMAESISSALCFDAGLLPVLTQPEDETTVLTPNRCDGHFVEDEYFTVKIANRNAKSNVLVKININEFSANFVF